MKIICIGDTHNRHDHLNIPYGDIIIHAGDCTDTGTREETQDFLIWFAALPHQHKILIGGNHDFYIEKHIPGPEKLIPDNITYLQDSGITIKGYNFWGSPFTPTNGNWAFKKERGKEILQHWNKIPASTHFLITHTPPYGILDELDNKSHIGCEKLIERVNQLKIPHHIFGHNHNDYGIVRTKNTVFFNAASLDNKGRVINSPLVLHTSPS